MFFGIAVKVARQIENEKSADLFPNKHENCFLRTKGSQVMTIYESFFEAQIKNGKSILILNSKMFLI